MQVYNLYNSILRKCPYFIYRWGERSRYPLGDIEYYVLLSVSRESEETQLRTVHVRVVTTKSGASTISTYLHSLSAFLSFTTVSKTYITLNLNLQLIQ